MTPRSRSARWIALVCGGLMLFAACAPAAPRLAGDAPRPAPLLPVDSGPARDIRVLLLDSLLSNEPLRGALVALSGRTNIELSDAFGQVRLDSVSPGHHRLVLRHPLLDSIGVDTLGLALRVTNADTVLVASLPTEADFMASRCPARRGQLSDGILMGVVRDAATDQPLPDIEVAIGWRGRDTSFAGSGMRERTRVRSSARGQFTFCAVPRFSIVELWARHGEGETARIRLQLGRATLGAYDLSLERTDAAATLDALDLGVIAGRIVVESGAGLPNVSVALDRPSVRTLTDADGRFVFPRVPPGVRSLQVRAVGFRPSSVGINVRSGMRVERDITIDRTAAMLGTVTVRASRSAGWDSVGFESRRRRGGGYFLTNEDLKGTNDLAAALRLVPGVSGRSTDRSQRLVAGRGAGCLPAFVVNGVRFQAGGAIGPEAMIRAADIRAIEIYTSRISTPPEYQRPADCAVIVIWLRDPQREREAAAAREPLRVPPPT